MAPPGPVTDLTVTATTPTSISLSWTNPGDPDLAAVIVRRAAGATPPSSATNGTTVSLASAKATSVIDTALSADTQYSYAVFTRDSTGNAGISPGTLTASTLPIARTAVQVPCGQITTSTEWSPDRAAVYLLNCNVVVPDGTTLSVRSGVVIKAHAAGSLRVERGGSLIVAGTEAQPVTFTSWRDDSSGGDTNGDGNASTPQPGDWNGINAIDATFTGTDAPFSLRVEHARLAYANYGISTYRPGGAILIRDTEFSDMTEFGVSLELGNEPAPRLQNNTFIRTGTNQAQAIAAAWIRSPAIDPDLISGNTGHANSYNGVLLEGILAADGVLTGQSGFPIGTGSRNVTTPPNQPLSVAEAVTVTVPPPGTVVKNAGSLRVERGGSLIVAGTETQPVTFTSWRDDSSGGDTNGDGSATAPSVHDWGGVQGSSDTEVDVSHTTIRFASTGLTLQGGTARLEQIRIADAVVGLSSRDSSKVTLRGSFLRVESRAIESCNWASDDCGVDASYVDWGEADGPYHQVGDAPYVCGKVTVQPWVGRPTADTASIFGIPNCDGSATPEFGLARAQVGYYDALSGYQGLCAISQDACDQVDRMQRCYAEALNLAKAGSTFPILEDAEDWGTATATTFVEGTTDYIKSTAQYDFPTFAHVTPAVLKIGQLVGLGFALESAYNNCR
ncbi:MAG: fibronectin type III domain-containing protein [Candidatus Nanopelagicales bacterium]